MIELAEKWDGIPRTIVDYYFDLNHMTEDDYRGRVRESVEGCTTMLQQGSNCDLGGAPSYFYFIRPQKDDRTMRPYVYVPTRTLHCFLAEGLRLMGEALKLEFFTALSMHGESHESASYIYESWFNSFFSTHSQVIDCHWVWNSCRRRPMLFKTHPRLGHLNSTRFPLPGKSPASVVLSF